jgi:hypothetical protein
LSDRVFALFAGKATGKRRLKGNRRRSAKR